jgi:aspartokinase/homoserine dehydrogenase 1
MNIPKKEICKVFKFGGSSLADTACFVRVSKIILDSYYANEKHRHGIIVSAMGGFTDLLIKISENRSASSLHTSIEYKSIMERVFLISNELLDEEESKKYIQLVTDDFIKIQNILDLAYDNDKVQIQNQSNIIAGFGELWSAQLLNKYLNKLLDSNKSTFVDSRKTLFLSEKNIGDSINWIKSKDKFNSLITSSPSNIYVVTGFIASEHDGTPTNLGRNGSDYSAAIFASLFDAKELVIWTDVDGVLSADPNKVKSARLISNLSYNEAMELAYFGAKVIHPKTFSPLVDQEIPIYIKNTFSPNNRGTKISSKVDANREIKGITVIESMALINVEGTGMLGVPGTADKLFASLKDEKISVSLISQASSEHSICIAIAESLTELAFKQISNAFSEEINSGLITDIDITNNLSVLAVVGDNMAGQHGIAGKFFSTLGKSCINVRAIAQGSSERNISAVIDTANIDQALNDLHAVFFGPACSLSIGLIGPGLVGNELLNQINDNLVARQEIFGSDISVKGIASSKVMLLSDDNLNTTDWVDCQKDKPLDLDIEQFSMHIKNSSINGHALIIDCTSSDLIAAKYKEWLEQEINVITPNKKAFSSDQTYYQAIKTQIQEGEALCLYETTVAAGLPVIGTIQNLIATGDVIHSIEGIFSGTLAYLFNVYDGTKPFSQIVIEAKESGYTEPDPRDDLGGMDVARKLTILSREIGRKIEINNLSIESLFPDSLADIGVDEFLEKFADFDAAMQERYLAARNKNMTLRYVASIGKDGDVFIGIKEFANDHAFSNIQLTDNIVKIQSDRYADNPMIIQGPGAGAGVTAAGISANIVDLVKSIK